MRTISFISAKGGSGKTIITATIADFLGKLGKKVLIVDSDGSTNGMTLFYLKEIKEHTESSNKCYGILENSFSVDFSNYTKINDNVFLLPATYEFVNTDSFDVSSFEQNITSVIDFHKHTKEKTFDYVLIDCQAGVDIHSAIVVKETISDEIIIVSEFDPISAAGIERLKGLFHKESIYNRSWVLLNKVLPELANTSNDFLEITRYLPPIIWTSEVVKRYSRKELALDLEYGNEYTLNIVKLLKVLFGKEIKKPLDEWLNSREEIIKKPIYDEYLKLQEELNEIEKSEKTGLYSSLMPIIASITGIVSVVITVFGLQKTTAFNELVKGVDNIWVTATVAFLVGIFTISFFRLYSKRKQLSSMNEFRKDILVDRLKELEKLKHSDIEKILKKK